MADLRARVAATGPATLAISAPGQGQRGRRRRNHQPDRIHQPICAAAVSALPLTGALAEGSQPESRLPRPAHQRFGCHDTRDGGGCARDGMGRYPPLSGGVAAAFEGGRVAVAFPARGRTALAPRVFSCGAVPQAAGSGLRLLKRGCWFGCC